jgi:hypothetical protein
MLYDVSVVVLRFELTINDIIDNVARLVVAV